MSKPLEHDYIRLSEVSSMENPNKTFSSAKTPTFSIDNEKGRGLKTELSLGLPGSESPERKPAYGVTLFGKELDGNPQNGLSVGSLKNSASGAKRGFPHSTDGSEEWVLSINGRSEANLCKDGGLYSPREVPVPSTPKPVQEKKPHGSAANEHGGAPAAKAQVVGWPPIRSFRKNTMASTSAKNNGESEEKSVPECLYVKVSMDGAPYLRKVDLQVYRNYIELSSALEKMFSCFITGHYGSHGHVKSEGSPESHSMDNLRTSEYVLTYEDKDGDWMLVGDVPWKMFTENCRKLRIMKGSEAIGLAPNAAEKGKVRG